MSLSEFSSVMKARASLLNNPNTFVTIDSWTDALESSLKVPKSVSPEKFDLSQAASLLVQDKVTLDGKPISMFRNLGQALSHNVAVVTEEGLRRHWKFYNLKMPVVTDTEVSPGTSKYNGKPLLKAYITWYESVYKKRNKAKLELFSNTGIANSIDEATGIKYSQTYTNTATDMVAFLSACGLSKKECADYSKNFEVGHIESQAFIRLKVTRQGGSFYNNNFIDKIIKLHEQLDLASSSLLPEYEALTASVLKATSNSGNLSVSVEMQLKDVENNRDARVGILASNTNQGSGRLSRALNFVALLRDIGSMEGVYSEDKNALRQIGQDTEVIAIKLNEIYKNYKQNLKEVRKALNSSFPNNKQEIADFLLDLKSSKTLRQHIKNVVLAPLTKDKVAPFIANIKDTPVKSFKVALQKAKALKQSLDSSSNRTKSNLKKLKVIKKKADNSVGAALRLTSITQDSPTNLVRLQNLINRQLQDVISANMGDGNSRNILNYRTGRLASSAKVERLSESRAGMITAFYSYMKNPYATFSDGGQQSSPKSRDPKLLISKSIREIAQQQVANRLRAVAI